jgi:hypothetical protein
MGTHARLSPSNARWPNCPGSVREEASYIDVAGAAAIDGTGSHLLLEMCLDNAVPAIVYDGQVIGANDEENPSGWLVSPDRIDRVQMCLDYVSRRVKELEHSYPGATITVEAESKSDVGGMFGRDDWSGTCDVTITARHMHTGQVYFIEVIDYKDGRGWVHVPNNTQLLSYLVGKMRTYIGSGPQLVAPYQHWKVGGVRMTIVQPKVTKPIRYQCSVETGDITPGGVVDAANELSKAAYATDDPNAHVVSGKHCQWCKANPKRGGHCVAATEQSIKSVIKMDDKQIALIPLHEKQGDFFAEIKRVVADPRALTSAELSDLLDAKDAFMVAFDLAHKELKGRVEGGESVSGWAMRSGKGANVWALAEEEIEKKLKAKRLKLIDIYPKKLISPAQVLKLENLTKAQKAAIKKDLISFKAGKLALTKVAHSDTKVVQSATDMFMGVEAPAIMDKMDFF